MVLTPEVITAIRAGIAKCGSLMDFSHHSGIPDSTLSRILSGQRRTITDETAAKLANALGYSERDLHLVAWGISPDNQVREAHAPYRDKYDRLAVFLRKSRDATLESMIFAAAEAAGFSSKQSL